MLGVTVHATVTPFQTERISLNVPTKAKITVSIPIIVQPSLPILILTGVSNIAVNVVHCYFYFPKRLITSSPDNSLLFIAILPGRAQMIVVDIVRRLFFRACIIHQLKRLAVYIHVFPMRCFGCSIDLCGHLIAKNELEVSGRRFSAIAGRAM